MRTLLILWLCIALLACSDSSDTQPPTMITEEEQESVSLPFQDFEEAQQPRGGSCENGIVATAPLISSGMGFDSANTRNARSVINSGNVADLALNYSLATDGATEMRGAAAVTAQVIFFTAGNTLQAINRNSGCTYWRYESGTANNVFRSASVLLHTTREGKPAIFVGDYFGNVHALDAVSGELLWQVFAGDDATHHFITGGMQAHRNTLVVPISSKEVVTGAFNPEGCCRSHGMLVALNATTGRRLWSYHTTPPANEVILPGERIGPNGAPVWATPTIDVERKLVYLGTGQNYTEPTTETSDAIIALELRSGRVRWIFQATAGDAWNYACEFMRPLRCPDPEGHDFDFGAAPVLVAGGSRLLAADKGGMVYALDPDNGEVMWSRKLSLGSKLGGIHWGLAADERHVFAAATDFEIDPASGNLEDLIPGAHPGIWALDIDTGEVAWEVRPERAYEGLDTPLLFSAALAVTNDLLIAGSLSGSLHAFSKEDGEELWSFDAAQDLVDINGKQGDGGTIDGAGFVISGDGVVINSGYTALFGGVGRYQAGTGNTLLVLRLGGAP